MILMATIAKPLHHLLVLQIFSLLIFSISAFPLEREKACAAIRRINSRGPYLGLITVYAPEENAFFANARFKDDPEHPYIDLSGRRFRVGTMYGKKAIYVRCGVGMVNAATATQQMLDLFHIKGLIHFGVAGNTNSSLSVGDVSVPEQLANTGLWDWLKPDALISKDDVVQLDIVNYNVPQGGNNLLGRIGYRPEQFCSEAGSVNAFQKIVWFPVSPEWLQLAAGLKGMDLEQCVNSSFCLPNKPKVVIGLRGSTSNTFVDNAAYRDFLFQTFGVSSADMESSAVVMTSLSNGFPVIVFRGLSDIAGGQEGETWIRLFASLAASNVARVVVRFIKLLPVEESRFQY